MGAETIHTPQNEFEPALIDVNRLRKVFSVGVFRRKTVQAVKNVSFQVKRGEIFGFLGPNGAGKTTTIKMLMGLIAPTSGSASLFGIPVSSPKGRAKIGFLPENPYVYPYLTPREFVSMSGQLSGMYGSNLKGKVSQALDKVGILYAADRQVRRLSKGMLQRTGLAAAMIAEPEMLILDEPMSGLDPVGRKEVRDLIFEERKNGKTIFFSTHILSDVETMCDRVTILRNGEVTVTGSIRQLLKGDVLHTDVVLEKTTPELLECLKRLGTKIQTRSDVLVVETLGQAMVHAVIQLALEHHAAILEVAQRRETLEDLFMKQAL